MSEFASLFPTEADQTGNRSGNQSPEIRYAAGHGPWAGPRPCPVCKTLFCPTTRELTRGRGKYCSIPCGNIGTGRLAKQNFRTPESTKEERVRANGLVNMRIRRGHVERPAACQHCDKPGRVDGHHPDYQQPSLVVFLCRSCHMKAHHHPEFEREVAAKARLAQREAGAA